MPVYPAGFAAGELGHVGIFLLRHNAGAGAKLIRELDVTTPFRQVEAQLEDLQDEEPLAGIQRADLEGESRRFAEAQGFAVDWEAVGRLDDEALVNGIAQIAPFDGAAKQALLEAPTLAMRADLIVQLMRFFGRHDGEERVTLQ